MHLDKLFSLCSISVFKTKKSYFSQIWKLSCTGIVQHFTSDVLRIPQFQNRRSSDRDPDTWKTRDKGQYGVIGISGYCESVFGIESTDKDEEINKRLY